MTLIKTIFLSGWFQLILLGLLFAIYSRRVLIRRIFRGYALGWMLGLFFIFSYTAVSRPDAFYISAYDYSLNVIQVVAVTTMAMFISIGMSVLTYTFRDSSRWHELQVAALTSIFVIVLFLQFIAAPDVRLMASLFVLAFGMTTLFATIIISRRYGDPPVAYVEGDEYYPEQAVGSRLDAIRQRIVQRINRNDVPTNYPEQY